VHAAAFAKFRAFCAAYTRSHARLRLHPADNLSKALEQGLFMGRIVGWLLGWTALCGVAHAQSVPSSIMLIAVADVAVTDAPKLWSDPVRHLTIQLPGMSHHFDPPVDKNGNPIPGREFNEQNWGVGLQLERPLTGDWSQWVSKTSFGVMKDSLNAMGAYAGHTWQKRVIDGDTYTADIGGGAFLFYRTLRFDGPHLLVPGVLPVLSATHKQWGLGINLVAVPRVKLSSGTMPNVLYAQFTKSF
jgi:hypothetical protein